MLTTDPDQLRVEGRPGRTPLVLNAPVRLEMGLNLLRCLPDPVVIAEGVMTVGTDPDGNVINYRVMGWNDEQQTLTLWQM